MLILAFDTCLGAVSAAVNASGRVFGRFELCPSGHAERLMPVIEATCADAGVVLTDIQRIAVTFGPGGFTGLRVGLSAARAFALALGVPVVGISSLELLARSAEERLGADRIAATAPAGRAGVYVQSFAAAPFMPLGPPRLLGPDDTDPDLALSTAVGGGAGLLAHCVAKVADNADDYHPDAAMLARLAPGLVPLSKIQPIYLRAADAKPQVGKGLARADDSRQT